MTWSVGASAGPGRSGPLARPPSLAQRGPWYLAAELGCLMLGLALALSTVRLFEGSGAVAMLAVVATGAWGLSVLIRHSFLSGWVGDVVHLGIGTLGLLLVVAPEHRWGFLPTPDSMLTLVQVVRDDFARFDQDIAPLAPRTGHLVVLASLVWLLALFASTAAMRFRAPVQGAIPHTVAILGLGFVARSSWRYESAAILLVGLGAYALTQIAWRNSMYSWVPHTGRVSSARLGTGAAIAVVATLVAATITPLLPVGVEPVLDVRRGGLGDGGPRTVVSPFVEVGANLGPRSNELLFTMEADAAQYWRLTALDTYDAANGIWVLSNSYSPVDGQLDPRAPSDSAIALDVRGLGGIWVPSPADPVTTESDLELNWDKRSGSLIKRNGDLESEDSVDFRDAAEPFPLDPATLEKSLPFPDDGALTDISGAPPDLRALSASLAEGLTPYDSLLALQNYFRNNYSYDETADFSADADPLDAFLSSMSGFCQQFSTAFALGARSLGFPARVVVGFTQGDSADPADGEETRTFAVRGRHAHAWPEVLFRGVGWVPFEPTPGRGNPASVELTGVPPAQAAPPEGATGLEDLAPTTVAADATTTVAPSGNDPTETPSEVNASAPETPSEATGERSWFWVLGAVVMILAISAAAVPFARKRRGPTRSSDPVERAWLDTLSVLGQRGLSVAPHETPGEYATRCNRSIEVPELIELAALEAARRWSGEPTDARAEQEAVSAAESILNRSSDDTLERSSVPA